MRQDVVSSYLRSKLSSILEEAEADSGSPSDIISRFRSTQIQIESTEASLIAVGDLYDLVEALSECRVFAYQRRTPQFSKKGFNLNKLYRPLSELMFRRRIRKRLDTIDKKLPDPSPRYTWPPAGLSIPLTQPIPDPSLIIGLDAEAEIIEAWLMATASSEEEEGEALRAVGIVGRCGCGKTALAQKVFASYKVKQEFSPRIWVCLSNMLLDNDVPRVKVLKYVPRVKVLKSILGNILPRDKLDDSESNFDKLLDMLQKELMGKRYLIVLDDAWRLPGDPDTADFLSQLGLPKGSRGAVIVTSRRKDVISRMVGDEHVIRLEPGLSGEICWQILSTGIQHQGELGDIHRKLSRIEDEVKRNFDGLPLIAKSFATILPHLLKEEVKVFKRSKPVVGSFLPAIIQKLFQQFRSIMALPSWEKKLESHFYKLRHNLLSIQAVLEDAEEKQFTQDSVELWLEMVRDLAYELEDVLDEITTQALVQHSNTIQQSRVSMVSKLIPAFNSFAPSAIVSKIKEITNRFQVIARQRTKLNLSKNLGGSHIRSPVVRSPSTCLPTEHEVYGREEDKQAIIKMLLTDEQCHDGVSVISIVGMGGLGKTTLARLVYNDTNVKQNFDVRAWVCVSSNFDVMSITNTLYESVTGRVTDTSKDLNTLQAMLKEELRKSKLLVVLDDVRNVDYKKWDYLRRSFQFGTPGSRIIITTRNVVGSRDVAYRLDRLSDDDCLSILAQHSGLSSHENPEFEAVGVKLAHKCEGLPLTALTLGGLLRSKETERDCFAVLYSIINWDQLKENIPSVLSLCYHYLPSHLKPLFAYCSIFPKDYNIKKNELIYLWMGEGFLENLDDSKSEEELGLEFFNELLSRSFFQRSVDSDEYFVMHDLIHELAHSAARGTCYHLDTIRMYEIPDRARHVSFLRHEDEVFRENQALSTARRLRAFLPMPVQTSAVWPSIYLSNKILAKLVQELHSLRVLSLSGYSITELPSSVCNLIHLRYLNLSGTSIITLPHTLGDIYNLRTLSLHKCRSLCKLPSTLGKLSNLRHLDNSDTNQLKDMPVEIGKLKNLRTLPKIVLSKGGGLGLRELRGLKHLRGSLSILELQNVTNIEDVKDAILFTHKLDELQLTWGSDVDQTRDRSAAEKEVLDRLRPCDENLRSLKIASYGGFSFPSWIGLPSFRNLSSISILSCLECKSLPSLGQLPELKHLLIESMPNIKCISTEFYGSGVMVPFPKLETLRFDHMPEWEEWAAFADGEDIKFPHLHQLTMSGCSKLTRVSPLNLPVLRELDVEECSEVLLESFCNLDSLNSLKVVAITGLSYLPERTTMSLPLGQLPELKHLLIGSMPNVRCISTEFYGIGVAVPFPKLETLRFDRMPEWEEWAASADGKDIKFPHLHHLTMSGCSKLTRVSPLNLPELRELGVEVCSKELLESFCNLVSLNYLKVVAITGLSYLPRELTLSLSALEVLDCRSCSELLSLWPNETPLEHLTHLKRIVVADCNRLVSFGKGEQQFPSKLKVLEIYDCDALEPLPRNLFARVTYGDDMIAGIPRGEIDGTYVRKQSSL